MELLRSAITVKAATIAAVAFLNESCLVNFSISNVRAILSLLIAKATLIWMLSSTCHERH